MKGEKQNMQINKTLARAYCLGSELIEDYRAFHPVITGVVVLAMVGIVFGIMVMVYSNIQTNITGNDDASNATISQVNTNVYKGFNLGSIAPIVLAAGLIITIVIGFAGMVMGGQ
jgi:hypothetical protein